VAGSSVAAGGSRARPDRAAAAFANLIEEDHAGTASVLRRGIHHHPRPI
jgi:hypothetical protein